MFRNLTLALLSLSILVPAAAFARQGNPMRCAERVREEGCPLSNNDMRRVFDNVVDCKQANSRNGQRLEIFQLAETGKVVVINVSQRGGQYCSTTKYMIDYSGINTIKVISGNTFMLSNAGRVYFMMGDENTYEVLNARGRSFSNVIEIRGADSGRAIELVGPGFANVYSMAEIIEKAYRGQLRALNFVRSYTNRSIFRDE